MSNGNYSQNQADDIGFPYFDYEFPNGGGTFTGTLVFKKWSKKASTSLICYFDTDDGEKLKMCVWFSYDDERTYRPKQSDVDMKKAELNTKWQISHSISRSGKTIWLTADPIA